MYETTKNNVLKIGKGDKPIVTGLGLIPEPPAVDERELARLLRELLARDVMRELVLLPGPGGGGRPAWWK